MKYQVEITATTKIEIKEAYLWIKKPHLKKPRNGCKTSDYTAFYFLSKIKQFILRTSGMEPVCQLIKNSKFLLQRLSINPACSLLKNKDTMPMRYPSHPLEFSKDILKSYLYIFWQGA